MRRKFNCADSLAEAKKYRLINKNFYTVRAKLMDRNFLYKDFNDKLKKGKKGQYLLEGHNKYQMAMDADMFIILFEEYK